MIDGYVGKFSPPISSQIASTCPTLDSQTLDFHAIKKIQLKKHRCVLHLSDCDIEC